MNRQDPPDARELVHLLQESAVVSVFIGHPEGPTRGPGRDADIAVVVDSRRSNTCGGQLRQAGFSRVRDVESAWSLPESVRRYVHDTPDGTLMVDVHVDRVRSQETGASWSFQYLQSHCDSHELAEDAGPALAVPEPALRFALALHSGLGDETHSLTSLLQAVETDRLERHLYRGDPRALVVRIETVLEVLDELDCEETPVAPGGSPVSELRSFLWARLHGQPPPDSDSPFTV